MSRRAVGNLFESRPQAGRAAANSRGCTCLTIVAQLSSQQGMRGFFWHKRGEL